jgi:hypothetical protein
MATTLPEVLSSSSLPSTTKLAGVTWPLTESRSCFRTITFLWVEGIGPEALSKPARAQERALRWWKLQMGFSHFPEGLGQREPSQ